MSPSAQERLMAVFLEEATEDLGKLGRMVLELEDQRVSDPNRLREIFRLAHTLKGSASVVGRDDLAQVGHAMETCLDQVRRGTLSPSREVIDALLKAVDALQGGLGRALSAAEIAGAVAGLKRRLLAAPPSPAPTSPAPTSPAPTSPSPAPLSAPSPPSADEILPNLLTDLALLSRGGGRGAGSALHRLATLNETEASRVRPLFRRVAESLARALAPFALTPPPPALLEAALLAVDFLQGAAQDGGAEELAGVVEEMLKAPAVASSSSSVRTPAATLASSSSPASSGSAKTGPSGTFRASESSVPPTPSRVDGAGATPVFREATVRVPVTLLDGMVYRIDELVALKLRLDYERRQLEDTQLLLANTLARAAAVPAALSSEMEAVKRRLEVTRTDLAQEVHLLGLTAQALQEDVKDVRMLPVGPLLDPFRRMVRDLASSLSKEVVLEVLGEEVRIDKRILEMVRDPLMHLLRNAVDHGLETPAERVAAGKPARGTIVIQAENRESAIRLSVRDDGRGMDHRRLREVAVERGLIDNHRAEALTEREALNLVFMPSFSTSAQVTEISGRGVGLDVVRENIARLGGKVEFYSDPGRGTNFNLILPLTMATSSGLMVKTGTSVYAIPLLAVDEVVSVEPGEVGRPQGRLAISRRRQTISLVPLGDLLSGRALRAPEAHSFAVIVALSDRRVAVGVDQVLGQEEMVVKGVTSGTPRLKFVVGATSLADGKLVAVLDPGELMDAAMGTTISLPRAERRTGRATVLVAEDSLTSRTMIASVLEQAGYRALTAFDGQNALSQLRQTPVDLVVSDVEMPNLDGLGLIRALRGVPEHARTPAILLTSLGSVDARARGAQVGASAYLVKQEFDPAVFLTLVAELLEMAVDR